MSPSPRAVTRLTGIQRLKLELEGLEGHIKQLVVPDEVSMRHPPLVDPASGDPGSWQNAAALMPFGGFELLREAGSEHRFKGETMQGINQVRAISLDLSCDLPVVLLVISLRPPLHPLSHAFSHTRAHLPPPSTRCSST